LPKKGDRETVISQAHSSPQLLDFLYNLLLDDYADGLLESSNKVDSIGKAKEAKRIFEILKGLEND
jgi:hypothetical protein